jgi:uncharacterized protein
VPTASGGVSEDAPIAFDPDDMAGHLEVLATNEDFSHAADFIATLVLRVRSMLADGRLAPIVAPAESPTLDQWLPAYVVARVVFEALQRYRRQTGDELPTVVVLEEAHTFVQRHLGDEPGYATPARMCRETSNGSHERDESSVSA